MEMTNGRTSVSRSGVRPAAILLAIATIACGVGLGSQDGWARHAKQKLSEDPCTTLSGYMTKRLESMRALKQAMDKEQSVPNTMEGVFDLMQGKRYVDHEKTERLGRMRQEADDLDRVMRGTGCTPVDIDQELQKPPTPTIR